jgi:hypothetical protein
MNEIWKDVIGYEGLYQVSNLGRIKSLPKYDRKGRFHPEQLKAQVNNGGGYLVVNLKHNGCQKMRTVHRLVAEAFLDNPNKYPVVNHIDGNKKNNCLTNLEFCTHSSNMLHAVKLGLHTDFGQRKVLCVETGKIFDSTIEAEKWVGIKPGNSRISSCCYQRRGAKTCGGYHWRYVE